MCNDPLAQRSALRCYWWLVGSLVLLALSSFVTMILILVVYSWHRADTERRVNIVMDMQRGMMNEHVQRNTEHTELRRLLLLLVPSENRAAGHEQP